MAIPSTIDRSLEQSGILRTMAIDLSDNVEDRAMIIEVLRSKLYSDKILAPIREYSTNAADSHVEAGNSNTPIKVTLPTAIFPEFRIRDYGIGLTPDEIERIYIKYGRSTKRGTNAQTGQLGLGCKSAFAYGDNFIVVSYKDGVKTIYNLTISGVCTVVAAEPMSDDEKNGIEVVIPVKQNDVKDFQSKAIEFFKYWKICPELTGGDIGRLDALREELAIKPIFSDETWEIRPVQGYYYGHEKGIAVMGNVPYPINWDIVSNKLNLRNNDKDSVLYDFIRSNRTILRFNIGDLDFSASRESLEYTDKTCKTIVEKVREILDSIFNILNSKISTASDYWNALMIYNQIFGRGDEKLFQGDMDRIESYYKGKFHWNNIVINSGAYENLNRWDTVLGYSADGNFKAHPTATPYHGNNPILTVYEMKNGRLKEYKNGYSSRIPAGKNTKIVIHDLDKNVMVKSAIRYLFNIDPNNRPTRIYFLRFKDSAQQKHFFDTVHFESAPVTYVSSIHDNVKAWVKASRSVSTGTPSGVRDPQKLRCFLPTNRKNSYGYLNTIELDRVEIDMKEGEGFYVDFAEGKVAINGNLKDNVAVLAHSTWVLFNVIGETPTTVYAFPERNRNAKWFIEAEKDEQWIKLENYLRSKEDKIVYGKGAKIAKASKYFKVDYDGNINIKFAEKILPLLKNKNGAMYKACVELSSEFFDMSELIDALQYFGMDKDVIGDCKTDFNNLFMNVYKTYPMMNHLDYLRHIHSTENKCGVSDSQIKDLAKYINLVDGE